jgi:hypothetical protein
MLKLFLLYLNLLFPIVLLAQERCILSGEIIDKNGDAIPYSSIYISNLSSGTMANIDGSFQISLPCKEYEFTIQSIGYKAKNIRINLNQDYSSQSIVLEDKVYGLQEVTVNSSSEDPAYNIIRKAIVMAQYYKKQIQAYECDVYVRSFYNMDDIPYLVEKLIKEEELRDLKVGNIYEAILHYTYEYPNDVKEKILHVKSGNKDTSKTGSSYINLNFYG